MRRVGLGKVCLLDQDTAINQDLRGIVPIDPKRLSVRFLFWWLRSIADLTLRIAGNGIREPHWHPVTAELGYVLTGRARMSIKSADGSVDRRRGGAHDPAARPPALRRGAGRGFNRCVGLRLVAGDGGARWRPAGDRARQRDCTPGAHVERERRRCDPLGAEGPGSARETGGGRRLGPNRACSAGRADQLAGMVSTGAGGLSPVSARVIRIKRNVKMPLDRRSRLSIQYQKSP